MAKTPKLSGVEAERVVTEYLAGNTVASICALHNISASTVRATVRRAGYELRPVGRPKTATGDVTDGSSVTP